MARKLNQREKRVIVMGVVAAVGILLFTVGADWLAGWRQARATLTRARNKMKAVEGDRTKEAGLLALVPALELPQPEESQKFLFRDKLHEQLKKAGIKSEPLQILPARKNRNLSYGVLKVKCRGKCQFPQLLEFLATLPENPYLVGIEELRIQCDTKLAPDKRKEVEIDLTVSTFVD